MDHESADRKAQNQQQRTSHTIALPKATVLVNEASPKVAPDVITPCIPLWLADGYPGPTSKPAWSIHTPCESLSYAICNPSGRFFQPQEPRFVMAQKKTARSAKLLAGTMFSMKTGLRGSNLLSTCARSLRSGAWLPPRSCRRAPEPRPDGLSSTRGNGPHR